MDLKACIPRIFGISYKKKGRICFELFPQYEHVIIVSKPVFPCGFHKRIPSSMKLHCSDTSHTLNVPSVLQMMNTFPVFL